MILRLPTSFPGNNNANLTQLFWLSSGSSRPFRDEVAAISRIDTDVVDPVHPPSCITQLRPRTPAERSTVNQFLESGGISVKWHMSAPCMEEGALLFFLRHPFFADSLSRGWILFLHSPPPPLVSPLFLPVSFFLSLLPPLLLQQPPSFFLFLHVGHTTPAACRILYIYMFGYRIECDALSGVVWPYDIARGSGERERERGRY